MSEILSEARQKAVMQIEAGFPKEPEPKNEIEKPIQIVIKGDCLPEDSREVFDKLDYHQNFSEYFALRHKIPDCVSEGYMHFEFDHETKKLYVFVIYDSTRKLTEEEENLLISYTQGQLSDGIGEGFEQLEFADGIFNPSPWHLDQEIELTYISE
ncbi:MAG: hypothetical protein HN981_03920 [Candidatus Pacebacteria bacterium]|jgi:hypothetical protein|nr:hypothetical protein [Candidatus Paceibacterota bacterium]MBT4652394.1 hypothetical protein [Candidatus Paceibacterota bacterium]MBT6756221.1 hypothetical protein [Candidatus Paceibacterota bacterium]MBT6921512.1 hypothetical protein [Candidatus Paceibacterota bacterium]